MRKLIAVLGILILALFASAGRAAADATAYDISGMFGGGTSTDLSTPGHGFSFTFAVDPSKLSGSPVQTPLPPDVAVTYTDTTTHISHSLTGQITFEASGAGGLLDIDIDLGVNHFLLFLTSSDPTVQLYSGTSAPFSSPSTPPGGFAIEADPGGCGTSFFGESMGTTLNGCTLIESGTVSAAASTVPEPSSLLLLASGLLGVTAFARRRFA